MSERRYALSSFYRIREIQNHPTSTVLPSHFSAESVVSPSMCHFSDTARLTCMDCTVRSPALTGELRWRLFPIVHMAIENHSQSAHTSKNATCTQKSPLPLGFCKGDNLIDAYLPAPPFFSSGFKCKTCAGATPGKIRLSYHPLK